jgi:hypothetical protein
MISYHDWVLRTVAFAENCRRLSGDVSIDIEVRPPISADEIDLLASQMPLGLPTPLSRFFLEGASKCRCKYRSDPRFTDLSALFPYTQFYIYGGVDVLGADELADRQKECLGWADSFDEYGDSSSEADSRIWHCSVPFMPIGNGDYLACDVKKSLENPPIAYLSHDGDGESLVIAPNFDAFLDAWENVCYIAPDFLSMFLDPATGFLTSDTPIAKKLRLMFQDAFATGELR